LDITNGAKFKTQSNSCYAAGIRKKRNNAMNSPRVSDATAARLFDQASSLERAGDFPAALKLMARLVDAHPAMATLHMKHGAIFWSNGEFERAIASFDQAIRLEPGNAEAFFCKASAQQSLGEDQDALANYDRALTVRPTYVEALNNKAVLLREAGDVEGAIMTYSAAIQADPDCVQAWVGKALCELLMGDLESGWRSYEWRKKRFGPIGAPSQSPAWQSEDLAGQTLLIQAEQGLGDTIQFCRFAKHAKVLGAKVILQVQDRLTKLISTLDPKIAVIKASDPAPACSYHIMLLSMPGIFRTRAKNVPSQDVYLRADDRLIPQWKSRIGTEGFKVGIHWQGEKAWEGIDKRSDKERSFPLDLFHGISQIPGIRLISLQKNEGLEQLGTLPPDMAVEVPGRDFDDGPDAFADSAAILANLDLVITSDTALAHLAGALGRPVWLALQYVPDWRWQLLRSDSPWYPHMRLFRQPSRGNWPAVFRAIENELRFAIGAT